MVSFIDAHRKVYGVEPICRVLPIAPSTYHAHIARRMEPTRRSARARRDDALGPEVRRVFGENFRVYGVCKVWRQPCRQGRLPERPAAIAKRPTPASHAYGEHGPEAEVAARTADLIAYPATKTPARAVARAGVL